MTATDSTAVPPRAPWTCPFCPLLCDTFSVAAGPTALTLVGSDCARARSALAQFAVAAPLPRPRVNGQACDLDEAIAAAAELLAASRQPLFAGLGTDVAGARVLYALACETGAICDPAQGAALMQGLRALQDRGGFTTTLAEVRTRADLIVCIGGLPTVNHPEFFNRCGLAAGDPRVVILEEEGDLFDTVAELAREVQQPRDGARHSALGRRLREARYAVIVYETGRLPAHGALIVEAVQRIVAALNRSTRAAAFALGGDAGAATVNQVFTWLSGLPLRSRAAPAGLEHEPLRFDASRLLADGAVDAMLWVSSFTADAPPPVTALPCIVLGHPARASACARASVFIPVATPGIGSAGHLFRTDGVVLLPLHRVAGDGLPTVAEVLTRLRAALAALRTGAAA